VVCEKSNAHGTHCTAPTHHHQQQTTTTTKNLKEIKVDAVSTALHPERLAYLFLGWQTFSESRLALSLELNATDNKDEYQQCNTKRYQKTRETLCVDISVNSNWLLRSFLVDIIVDFPHY
jgi:hypothetical protein